MVRHDLDLQLEVSSTADARVGPGMTANLSGRLRSDEQQENACHLVRQRLGKAYNRDATFRCYSLRAQRRALQALGIIFESGTWMMKPPEGSGGAGIRIIRSSSCCSGPWNTDTDTIRHTIPIRNTIPIPMLIMDQWFHAHNGSVHFSMLGASSDGDFLRVASTGHDRKVKFWGLRRCTRNADGDY